MSSPTGSEKHRDRSKYGVFLSEGDDIGVPSLERSGNGVQEMILCNRSLMTVWKHEVAKNHFPRPVHTLLLQCVWSHKWLTDLSS